MDWGKSRNRKYPCSNLYIRCLFRSAIGIVRSKQPDIVYVQSVSPSDEDRPLGSWDTLKWQKIIFNFQFVPRRVVGTRQCECLKTGFREVHTKDWTSIDEWLSTSRNHRRGGRWLLEMNPTPSGRPIEKCHSDQSYQTSDGHRHHHFDISRYPSNDHLGTFLQSQE